jgi:hypothetical protein
MPTEVTLWDYVSGGMAGFWHAQRHEDRYSLGIPDASFGIGRTAEGWMELKVLERMPRPGPLKWDFSHEHLTSEQRTWMRKRVQHGTGRVFVLCQIYRTYILWRWQTLDPMLGEKCWAEIEKAAVAVWNEWINWDEFALALREGKRIERRFKTARA